MKALHRGMLLALLQLVLVASLGAKVIYDRATRPRVWARTAPVDPVLPIRGRYLQLRIEARLRGDVATHGRAVALRAENGQLIAIPDPFAQRPLGSSRVFTWGPTSERAVLHPPLAFFLAEDAPEPSIRDGGELWVEVTVPKQGPPRPIRLGVKRGTGPITPL